MVDQKRNAVGMRRAEQFVRWFVGGVLATRCEDSERIPVGVRTPVAQPNHCAAWRCLLPRALRQWLAEARVPAWAVGVERQLLDTTVSCKRVAAGQDCRKGTDEESGNPHCHRANAWVCAAVPTAFPPPLHRPSPPRYCMSLHLQYLSIDTAGRPHSLTRAAHPRPGRRKVDGRILGFCAGGGGGVGPRRSVDASRVGATRRPRAASACTPRRRAGVECVAAAWRGRGRRRPGRTRGRTSVRT